MNVVDEREGRRRRQELEPGGRGRGFAFLIGFFGGGDGVAEGAGVFAVEGFADGLGDGGGAEVTDEHGEPRDRLEREPVSAAEDEEEEKDEGSSRRDGAHCAGSDTRRGEEIQW